MAESCRQIGVAEQTCYRWRKEYGGMEVEQVRRLKQQVLVLLGIGIGVGVPLTLAILRFIESQLFGVSALRPENPGGGLGRPAGRRPGRRVCARSKGDPGRPGPRVALRLDAGRRSGAGLDVRTLPVNRRPTDDYQRSGIDLQGQTIRGLDYHKRQIPHS